MIQRITAALSPISGPSPRKVLRRAFQGLLVLAAFGAAGCSTLSVSERSAACGTTDWRAYGLNDGRLGVPIEERSDLFEACLEAGFPVDMAEYRAGWLEGLEQYCTTEMGHEVGHAGGEYHGVCQGQAETAFLQGYEVGRKERPEIAVVPQVGIGVGIGRRSWGGIGLGFPIGVGVGHPPFGPNYLHRWPHKGYCFYNRPYCEARGWI